MLTLTMSESSLGQLPALLPGGVESLARQAQEDVTNFGLLGVVAGTLLTGVITYAAFKVSGTPFAAKPAAVAGLGAASLGVFMVLRRRAQIGTVPKLVATPPSADEILKALRSEWVVQGMRATR